jgi:hypothetical protein
MKFSKALLAAALLAFCITPRSSGRFVSTQSYQELLDKSDLVIIATPITKTIDTKEISYLPNIFSQGKDGQRSKVSAVGVETSFKVCAVLKGEKRSQQIVLHHYRDASTELLMDGPMLVFFDPSDMKQRSSYLLFLIREPDGRYAPTGGQTDPGFKTVSSVPLELN